MATQATNPKAPQAATPATKAATPVATTTVTTAVGQAKLAPTQALQLQPKYAACPKRPGTACHVRAVAYWPVYAAGGTVAQALAAGATRADLAWDLQHGFVALAPSKG
jgi:hypothetical protein